MEKIRETLKSLFDIYMGISRGKALVFCLILLFILFVIDKMLIHTFPALTSFGLTLLLGVGIDKTQDLNKKNKE